jgi:hypothetical protein
MNRPTTIGGICIIAMGLGFLVQGFSQTAARPECSIEYPPSNSTYDRGVPYCLDVTLPYFWAGLLIAIGVLVFIVDIREIKPLSLSRRKEAPSIVQMLAF